MIRKQVYLKESQERKLARIAKARGCSEAQIIRNAIDSLPDPDSSLENRLEVAGLLVHPDKSDPFTKDISIEQIEMQYEAWLRSRQTPLGLSEAVLEDRR